MSRRLTLLRCLIVRDFRLFACDRRAAAICFLVPVLLGTLFGLVFDDPSRNLGKVKLPLILVNEDDNPFTTDLLGDLLQSEHLEARISDRSTAERDLERRRVGVALYLPPGFGSTAKNQFRDRVRPTVTILHHPLNVVESEWVEGVLTELLLKRLARDFLEPMGVSSIEKPFTSIRESIPERGSSKFNSYSHSFAGMVLQYLLFWGMECGLLFLRERRRGIWNRLRAAPVPLSFLLLSRLLSTSLIALCQIAFTFLFAWVVFGVEISGSWLGFGLLSIGISFFASSTGLFVATMSGTEARARNLCILFILILSMLGGLWLPMFLLPRWVQELSWSLPTTWAMHGLDGATWMSSSLTSLLPSCAAVFAFGFAATGLAWIRFARMEQRSRRGENL